MEGGWPSQDSEGRREVVERRDCVEEWLGVMEKGSEEERNR